MKNWIRKALRLDVALLLLCVGFFLWQPYFDIYVSQLFYDAEAGFVYKSSAFTQFIYDGTNIIARSLIIALIVALVFFSFSTYKKSAKPSTENPSKNTPKKLLAYLLICGLFGPVLITDTIIKKQWDRPRPNDVHEFGGQYPFVPPFPPINTCDDCESFVSGHAAAGFFLFSVVFINKSPIRRRRWFIATLVIGGVIGGTRIVQGGHFLSDVIFSGFVVWFSTALVHYVIYRDLSITQQS